MYNLNPLYAKAKGTGQGSGVFRSYPVMSDM